MTTREQSSSTGDSLRLFTNTAQAVAGDVIDAYSTSFGMATRLLGKRHRTHVRNIYALVRVADEIVDGVARQAGLTPLQQADALAKYEDDTHQAMRTGYSSDLVVHAFACTARAAGIDQDLTRPFFESMRQDLQAGPGEPAVFDSQAHSTYVHGSAEVVGLMCLRVFMREEKTSAAERSRLEHGAKQLGAAFQNINFLRDLADDTDRLGRSYLSADGRLSEQDKEQWVREVRSQLADAAATIPLLPADARAAVRSAHALFANLTQRVATTPVERLYRSRVRVPGAVKMGLTTRALLRTAGEARR